MNKRAVINRVVLGAFLTLSSCSVGPDFHPPQNETVEAWPQSTQINSKNKSQILSEKEEISKWWKSFNDPDLISLIERSIESNLDLKLATARIRQARGARTTAIGGEFPEIDLSANYRRSQLKGNSSANVSSLFQSGLDATWELDIFGGTRREIEAANAEVLFQEEGRQDVFRTLAAEVALNYLNIRAFQEQLDVAKENLDAQKHSADVTHKRFDAGFASALDVANADAEVATTTSQIAPLEAELQKNIYSLSVLLGLEPDSLTAEFLVHKPMPNVPASVPIGLPSELLQRRPDVRQAEAKLHEATANVGVAVADLFPKFSLTGSFGSVGSSASALTFWKDHLWSFGPSVTLPIFDAGRIHGEIEVSEALRDQAVVEYKKVVLNAFNDVYSALVDYSRQQERLAAIRQAVVANEKAVAVAKQLYIEGASEFVNVLIAQRSLYASQTALVLSKVAIDSALVALYKALGGGWE